VARFVPPEEFLALKEEALALGFPHVESGPMVRSSYHADGQRDIVQALARAAHQASGEAAGQAPVHAASQAVTG
jgi:lipoic acid synthetase